MGLFFSCCRRNRDRTTEEDSLLPQHHLSTDRPTLSRPARPGLSKFAEVAAALQVGKLPSQDQLNTVLQALVRSGIFHQQEDGSRASVGEGSGKRVEEAFRATVDALLQVGLEKNYDDKIQDFVHLCTHIDREAIHADVAVDAGPSSDVSSATDALPSQNQVRTDAAEFVQSFRTLIRLLFTSSAFRLILSDIYTSLRESVADVVAGVGRAALRVQNSSVAAEDIIRPHGTERVVSQIDENAGHETCEKLQREGRDLAEDMQVQLEDVGDDARARTKQIVIQRVQEAIAQAHRTPSYRKALRTIFHLVRKYTSSISSAYKGLKVTAENGSQSLPTFTPMMWTEDPDIKLALSDIVILLSRFSSGHSVDDLTSAVYDVVWDLANIPTEISEVDQECLHKLKIFCGDLTSWFDLALESPENIRSASSQRQLQSLYDRFQAFLEYVADSDPATSPAFIQDTRILMREVEDVIDKFSSDKTTQKLLTALNDLMFSLNIYLHVFPTFFTERLTSLPLQISRQAQDLRRQARNDILTWFLPRVLRVIQVVPMPRIEYMDDTIEAVIDALLLSSSLRTSLLPDHIRFQATNDIEVDLTTTSSPADSPALFPSPDDGLVRTYARTKLHMDGIRLSAENVAYYILYKGPLGFSYEDEGLISIDIGSQSSATETDSGCGGLSLDVELEFSETTGDTPSPVNPLFSVKDVHVSIPNLHFVLQKTRHPILNALIQPLSGPVARTVVGYYLRRQMWEMLDALASFGGRVHGQVAETEETGAEAVWTAALKVLGDLSQRGDQENAPTSDTYTYPTLQGVVRTTCSGAGDNATESTLAVGVGAQILPGRGESQNLDDSHYGPTELAREAVDDIQGVVGRAVRTANNVTEDAVRLGKDAQEAGIIAKERRRLEAGEEGWRSNAFDW